MQRFAPRRGVVGLGVSGLLLVACARATLEDALGDLGEGDGSVGTAPSGGFVDATAPKPPPTSTATTPTLPPDPPADAGPDPIVDAGHDAPPPDPPVTCEFKNACPATVTRVGTVTGNLTTKTLTATGSTSEWVRVVVTDEGVFFGTLKLRAKLVQPPGAQYGLLAYEAAPSAVACTSPKVQDLGVDAVKTMNLSWGNSIGDDGKSVTFEVRRIVGTCTANDAWSLELTGTP